MKLFKRAPAPAPAPDEAAAAHLRSVRLHMMRAKGWRYLRYVHLSDFVRQRSGEIRSFCSAGSGLAMAELALALEFPQIEFYATDIEATGRPNYFKAMDLVMRWKVPNLRFGIWDLMKPAPVQFDAVASTEVLEHIQTPVPPLHHMMQAARRYTYALVPYADKVRNSQVEARLAAYLQHEHFVCGHDAEFFEQATLPGLSAQISGVYWTQHGGAFRRRLQELPEAEVDAQLESLAQAAATDLHQAPAAPGQCAGIKAVYAR